ncbi:molybdopterin-guanine dinucleotide biosynthesis protein B [Ramlibacter sp. H39-3-26]|uniref:molybdopterin-guanine dinucleotide biosynthesis protein B n=1 Tax=Curvibacter soli TaxID=3031331 RepID=UPI0023DA6E09|nr:molybdopterin-guanine dinucleotide biosynthesis protein B [Ramlibacter sp. H39-3-26]MDF1484285.1 molybdopterin-guanine dinucleotide biosynthesis protein B [Ramlibacter sp. H39-3-26]
MQVVCFAGYSGSGKTTLIEQLIPALTVRGLRVSVIKHAHHRFDVDQPGKDSYRHRQAGAFEVLVASDQRTVLMRENPRPAEPDVHALIAALSPGADWVIVEGFRDSDLPKVEVWRAPGNGYPAQPARYPGDPCVAAIATDAPPGHLPAPTALPVLDWHQPAQVADWLAENRQPFLYHGPTSS